MVFAGLGSCSIRLSRITGGSHPYQGTRIEVISLSRQLESRSDDPSVTESVRSINPDD